MVMGKIQKKIKFKKINKIMEIGRGKRHIGKLLQYP